MSHFSNWPREKVETLINEYESRPLLWDQKHPGYGTRRLREQAYSEIGKIINETNLCITTKINNLRIQYQGEIKKIERSKTTEKEKGLYVSKWWLFDRFAFLKENPASENTEQAELSTPSSTFIIRLNNNASDQESEEAVLQLEEIFSEQISSEQCPSPITEILKGPSTTTINTSSEQCLSPIKSEILSGPSTTTINTSSDQCPSTISETLSGPSITTINTSSDQCPSTIYKILRRQSAKKKKRKVMLDVAIQTTENRNQKYVAILVPDRSANKDVCDSYGKYIAGEIKLIPDLEQQQLLKLKIQQLIYYAHKGMLKESEYPCGRNM